MYGLSVGHMLSEEDVKEVYIHKLNSGETNDTDLKAIGKWKAQIMGNKPHFDALVMAITGHNISCRNTVPGAKRIELATPMQMKKFREEKVQVQKCGHTTRVTYGTLVSDYSSYTIRSMKQSTQSSPYYKPKDKLNGLLCVEALDDVVFFEEGECGAPLMTMPDETGTVYLLGILFAEDHACIAKDDKNKKPKGPTRYFACNLPKLFELLRQSKLADIATRMSGEFKTEPFFETEIGLLKEIKKEEGKEENVESGFVSRN